MISSCASAPNALLSGLLEGREREQIIVVSTSDSIICVDSMKFPTSSSETKEFHDIFFRIEDGILKLL